MSSPDDEDDVNTMLLVCGAISEICDAGHVYSWNGVTLQFFNDVTLLASLDILITGMLVDHTVDVESVAKVAVASTTMPRYAR